MAIDLTGVEEPVLPEQLRALEMHGLQWAMIGDPTNIFVYAFGDTLSTRPSRGHRAEPVQLGGDDVAHCQNESAGTAAAAPRTGCSSRGHLNRVRGGDFQIDWCEESRCCKREFAQVAAQRLQAIAGPASTLAPQTRARMPRRCGPARHQRLWPEQYRDFRE